MKKRMVSKKRVGIAIMAVALAALLLVTACAPAPSIEEKKVVRIGAIMALTGPAGTLMQQGFRNLIDYIKYFDEVGVPGVTLPPGVTIELVWADSGYEAARSISAYERMRNDVVYLMAASPVEEYAIKSRVERDGIPAMTMAIDEALVYPPGQFFTVFCTESERFAAVCDWIRENWEEERPPRVALMGTDTPNGRAPTVMGTPYAQSIGIEMLPFEIVPYLPLDSTPQLLRLREAGVDFIYIQSTWPTVIAIMKDAQRLGLLDKTRFGGMENSQSTELLDVLGPDVEGYFCARAFPWYTEVPIIFDIFRKIDGKLDTSGESAGLAAYCAMVKDISIAIDNVGYENLDGRAAKEAMYSIKDLDPFGTGRKVTYTPEDHRGSPMLRIYQVQGGDVVPVTDWRPAPMLIP